MKMKKQRSTAAGRGTPITYSEKAAPAPNPPQAVVGESLPHGPGVTAIHEPVGEALQVSFQSEGV